MGAVLNIIYKCLSVIFGVAAAGALIASVLESSETLSKLLPLILINGGISFFLWRRSTRSARQGQKLEQEAQLLREETISFINEINEIGEFPPAGSRKIISTPSRTVVFSCEAELHELTKSRRSKESILKLTKTESGELNITDKKLMFVSSTKNISLTVSSITSIDTYMNGFTVHSSGRAKPITFTVGNGFLCATLVRNLVEGKIEGNRLKVGEQLSMA